MAVKALVVGRINGKSLPGKGFLQGHTLGCGQKTGFSQKGGKLTLFRVKWTLLSAASASFCV